MKEFNIKHIEKLLSEQYDYPAAEIKVTAEQICNMSEIGKHIFQSYSERGILPDTSHYGLSILGMNKQRPDFSPISIIIIYDGLVSAISKSK